MSEKSRQAEYVTVDGHRIRVPTPEEDRRITAAALSDPDNPPLTERELASMRPAKKRGRPSKAVPKVLLTVRLDPEIVEYFKATGPGWLTRINEALAASIIPKKRKPRRSEARKSAGRVSKRAIGRKSA